MQAHAPTPFSSSSRAAERRQRRSRSRRLSACYYLDEVRRESGATALLLVSERDVLSHVGAPTPALTAFATGLGNEPEQDDVYVHRLPEIGKSVHLVVAGARTYELRKVRRDLMRIFA